MDPVQPNSEVLTPDEMDALLSMVGTTADSEAASPSERGREAVPYDFTRPDKFAREHLRLVKVIHDTYSRSLSNDLSLLLRTPIEATTQSVEPSTYGHFLQGCTDCSLIAVVEAVYLGSFFLMHIDASIAFAIADRLLGGSGAAGAEKKELTEIDNVLVSRVVKQLVTTYESSWSMASNEKRWNEFSLSRVHLGTETLHLFSASESVAAVTEIIQMPNVSGQLRICLPYTTLEPVLTEVGQNKWFETSQRMQPPEVVRDVESNVLESPIEVRVVLGHGALSVGQLKSLRTDDLLMLDRRVHEPLVIEVQRRPLLTGFPGLLRRNLAIRIDGLNTH